VARNRALDELAPVLLRWFDQNQRDLPWRKTRDPYAIWVSEIMLQQTRVETVRDYYSRWMRELPTLASLAGASEKRVLELWQGLGYYSRARRLLDGARYAQTAHAGVLPGSYAELLNVPGIGPYSAGAVASIAFGEAVPAIDGNVTRVFSRLFALRGLPTQSQHRARVEEKVRRALPVTRPGDFNQSVMELGATVCTPKSPSCSVCPVHKLCEAYQGGVVDELPERVERSSPTRVTLVVFLFEVGRKLELWRLSDKARWWAGLSGLPTLELGAKTGGALVELAPLPDAFEAEPRQAVRVALGRLGLAQAEVRWLEPIQHQVTRYRLELTPVWVRGRPRLASFPALERELLSETAILAEPLGAPFRKVLTQFFAARRGPPVALGKSVELG
jgi:A/G-specific adenine glycosylase